MRVQITVTDSHGKTYSGQMELTTVATSSRRRTTKHSTAPVPVPKSQDIEVTLGIRPFLKRHVTAKTSGPKKFVILLAWMAKASTSKEVKLDDLAQQWAAVKGPIRGTYQRVYATRAKDAIWADTPRPGVFKLLPNWKAAFTD